MSATTERPASATSIRPFTIETAEAELEDLRERIAAMRWPEKERPSKTTRRAYRSRR